jgi:uncharacterized phiE125 gp8 family phage protein
MSVRLITASSALAVSLAAARDNAKVDVDVGGTSALDAQITQAIRTHTAAAEHITGRRFITQTWALTLDCFPATITLPGSPLVSVDMVKYYDTAGVLQTLSASAYIVDTASAPGRIVPATTWPTTAARINAVEVMYKAGYGPDDTTVPDAAKGYILAMVQQQFAPVTNAKVENIERGLDSLRVYA